MGELEQLNGCVEPTDGTWRYEFHGCWVIDCENLVKVNRCIDAFADEFNKVRSHRLLGGLTPKQNLKIAT